MLQSGLHLIRRWAELWEEIGAAIAEQEGRFAAIVLRRCRDTAYHEAGHVVTAWHTAEHDFERVVIASEADRAAQFRAELVESDARLEPAGVVYFYSMKAVPGLTPPPEFLSRHVANIRHAIMVLVAGRLAERRLNFDSGEETDNLGNGWWNERWDDPTDALDELGETANGPGGDYPRAVQYARTLAGNDDRRIDAELRRCIRRVTRLLSLPNAWRAVERIAAELVADGELSRQAALRTCLAERVPFASRVPGYSRGTCRSWATEE